MFYMKLNKTRMIHATKYQSNDLINCVQYNAMTFKIWSDDE